MHFERRNSARADNTHPAETSGAGLSRSTSPLGGDQLWRDGEKRSRADKSPPGFRVDSGGTHRYAKDKERPGFDGSLRGRVVQVDPIKPMLKSPGTKPLKLQYDGPHSNSAFKFNLSRYREASSSTACTRHATPWTC